MGPGWKLPAALGTDAVGPPRRHGTALLSPHPQAGTGSSLAFCCIHINLKGNTYIKNAMFKQQRHSKALGDPHTEESAFCLCLLGNATALAFRGSAAS